MSNHVRKNKKNINDLHVHGLESFRPLLGSMEKSRNNRKCGRSIYRSQPYFEGVDQLTKELHDPLKYNCHFEFL